MGNRCKIQDLDFKRILFLGNIFLINDNNTELFIVSLLATHIIEYNQEVRCTFVI